MKKRVKIILDIVMTVTLLFLMAFQVTGVEYHEWIGAGMLIMFLLHNGLNFKWYQNIWKGKYSLQRGIRVIVNILVLLAILLTSYSGIVLSRYVFAFLPLEGGMSTARALHLAGSYWSFVLMSIHLGMHWSMVAGRLNDKKKYIWLLRVLAGALAVYGAFLFGSGSIFANMFLQNEFAILDLETPGVIIILQNLAMMITWAFVGHYMTKGMIKKNIFCILTAVVAIGCCIVFTPRNQDFIRIKGGTFQMGSPESERWRSKDETQHSVTVSDFYMSAYEVTQEEYEREMGKNPSSFQKI